MTDTTASGSSSWRSRLGQVWDSDLGYSLRSSPSVMLALAVLLVLVFGAAAAPIIAPHTPFDPATLNLMDARLPPAWLDGGQVTYPLGTDDQGRDMYSAILFGSRMSLIVGFVSVLFSILLGVSLGLLGGYVGGMIDGIVMRAADIQLSFPTILVAFFIDGVARYAMPPELHRDVRIYVVIF